MSRDQHICFFGIPIEHWIFILAGAFAVNQVIRLFQNSFDVLEDAHLQNDFNNLKMSVAGHVKTGIESSSYDNDDNIDSSASKQNSMSTTQTKVLTVNDVQNSGPIITESLDEGDQHILFGEGAPEFLTPVGRRLILFSLIVLVIYFIRTFKRGELAIVGTKKAQNTAMEEIQHSAFLNRNSNTKSIVSSQHRSTFDVSLSAAERRQRRQRQKKQQKKQQQQELGSQKSHENIMHVKGMAKKSHYHIRSKDKSKKSACRFHGSVLSDAAEKFNVAFQSQNVEEQAEMIQRKKVRNFLLNHQLGEYADSFLKYGADTPLRVQALTANDLTKIGMKEMHKRELLSVLKKQTHT
jgi:hypothetical protein